MGEITRRSALMGVGAARRRGAHGSSCAGQKSLSRARLSARAHLDGKSTWAPSARQKRTRKSYDNGLIHARLPTSGKLKSQFGVDKNPSRFIQLRKNFSD